MKFIKDNIKSLFGLFFIFLTMFGSVGFVLAEDSTSGAVNLKLLNQDPDPVKAGDIVTVRIGVENLGGEAIEDFRLEFKDTYPFSLFESEVRNVFVGKIFAHATGSSAQVVKFKLLVNEGVSEGNYPITVVGTLKNGATFEKNFDIEVKSEANAEISKISVDSLVPGVKTKISFTIKNVGKSDLENVKFSWNSQEDIILPVGSGNFKYIDRIEKEDEAIVDFFVVSDLSTEPKLYKLDLTLEYDDIESLQKITDAGTIKTESRREVVAKAGIYVGGGTDFEVSFKEFARDEATFTITNIGSNLANSVVVKAKAGEEWDVYGTDSDVVGNIKKGAFGRASFGVKPKSSLMGIGDKKDLNLDLLIEYTDTTGQRKNFTQTLNLKKNLFEKKVDVVSGKTEESSSKTWMIYAGVAVVLVGFFLWRRKRKIVRRSKN